MSKKLAKTEIFFTRAFPYTLVDRIPHLSAYIYMRDSVTLGGGKTPSKKTARFFGKIVIPSRKIKEYFELNDFLY